METLEAMAERKSTRSFKSDQVPEEILDKILKAGMSAPVGSGLYSKMHLTVIQNQEILNELGDATTAFVQKMIGKKLNKNFGAPVMIIISSEKVIGGVENINAGTVAENMLLAARDQGVDGIVWAGPTAVINSDEKLKTRLEIPLKMSAIMAVSLGYAATEETPKRHEIAVTRIR